jgi:hypothetical protein
VARRPSTVTLAIVLFVVAVAGALVGVKLARRGRERVLGSVVAERTPIGTFSFNADDCASGPAVATPFFGADVRGEGYTLRVVESGPKARLWFYPQTGRPAMALGKDDCTEWDVQVVSTDVTVNGVKTVSGHVNVTCTVNRGAGKVTAFLTFEHCGM